MAIYASFDYDEMSDGGGFMDNANVRILESGTAIFGFGGKGDAPTIRIKYEDIETGEIREEHYRAGKLTDWTVDPENKRLVSIGGAAALNKSTNAGMFMKHLKEAGYPMRKLADGDLSVLVGVEGHVDRVSAYRKGLDDTKDRTLLVMTKIHSIPGEKAGKANGKASGKASGKANGKPTTDANSSAEAETVDLRAQAEEQVMTCLMKAGKSLTKAAVVIAVQKALEGNPAVRSICNLIFQGDVLEKGPWKYENGVVSMG